MSDNFYKQIGFYGWNATVSGLEDGDMSLRTNSKSAESNIDSFLKKNKLTKKKRLLLSPSHMNAMVDVSKSKKDLFEKVATNDKNELVVNADAFISNQREYLLTMKPADCASVLIVSKFSKWYAFVHLGFFNLLFDTLESVMSSLNIYGDGWTAFVFRHIHKESYIYNGNAIQEIAKKAGYPDYVEEFKSDSFKLDLTGGITKQLEELGIEKIFMEEDDNYKLAIEGKSFSHAAFANKKQKTDGRFLVCAWNTEEK